MLEPCEGKLSCTVLRGEGGSNTADLLDRSCTWHFEIYGFSQVIPARVYMAFRDFRFLTGIMTD